jgi:FMN phosphatase YigB (HAD superfamily)
MAPSLLLFDFDGTLYRGNEPFRIYASAIAESLPQSVRSLYLDRVEQHLIGQDPCTAFDHWEAVVDLARIFGADAHIFDAAFTKTRTAMNEGACALEVPDALRAFLLRVRGRTTLAVASNSPLYAAQELMERLRLANLFDHIITDAQKPDGLTHAASRCGAGGFAPDRIASVGDHYRNDIAPAEAAGWRTAHIHPHGQFPGPSTVRGRQIEDILPFLDNWVSEWGS